MIAVFIIRHRHLAVLALASSKSEYDPLRKAALVVAEPRPSPPTGHQWWRPCETTVPQNCARPRHCNQAKLDGNTLVGK